MKRRLRGVTLIELMITLAVAIVLLAIGIPAFQSIQANSRAAAQANALVTALNLARSEAVGRGSPVAVCARLNDATCATTVNWLNGSLVFADPVRDGTPAADELVKAFGPLRGQPFITVSPSSVALIRFESGGARSSNPLSTRVKFQLDQAQTTGGQVRCICVSLNGQIKTERQACTTNAGACP
jgi:type IV fimbrial biogenesis protein FimT